jgi:hypothetical protein
MAFKITDDKERKIITVKYSGTITIDDRLQAVKEGTDLLCRTGYSSVLVDLSEATIKFKNPEEESKFAMIISSNDVLKNCKTAFLNKPGKRDNDYIEILARTRHYNFKSFTDLNEAYHWLIALQDG